MPDETNVIFDTIAIVGVGLIGGSLGMAAKKHGLARRIIGIGRSEQNLMKAKILGAIDDYSLDIETGAAEADLVVICTPVQLIVPVLERMVKNLKRGVVVTDVGSTKAEVVTGATAIMPYGCTFIGGHPMAGSEQNGVEAAFPDLFLKATYVLTPNEETDIESFGKMAALVDAIGARLVTMDPDQHDASAAIISHLPHALSASLLHLAEQSHRKHGQVFNMAAGSFRDLTRISDSDPALWRDICLTNAGNLCEAIDEFQFLLEEFKSALKSHDEQAIFELFERARDTRKTYLRIAK